jgi:hypothetical protein
MDDTGVYLTQSTLADELIEYTFEESNSFWNGVFGYVLTAWDYVCPYNWAAARDVLVVLEQHRI